MLRGMNFISVYVVRLRYQIANYWHTGIGHCSTLAVRCCVNVIVWGNCRLSTESVGSDLSCLYITGQSVQRRFNDR